MVKRQGGSQKGSTHFKKSKKMIINRYLYGLMYVENITISLLGRKVGVTRYTVIEWIYNGRIPQELTLKKVCKVLNAPHHMIFNEYEINSRLKLRNDIELKDIKRRSE